MLGLGKTLLHKANSTTMQNQSNLILFFLYQYRYPNVNINSKYWWKEEKCTMFTTAPRLVLWMFFLWPGNTLDTSCLQHV